VTIPPERSLAADQIEQNSSVFRQANAIPTGSNARIRHLAVPGQMVKALLSPATTLSPYFQQKLKSKRGARSHRNVF
jgi:hypothetical protein